MRSMGGFRHWSAFALLLVFGSVPVAHARPVEGNPPPDDGSTGGSACQRTYPDPQPYAIDSTYVADVIAQAADPADIAIFSNDHDAIHMIVEKSVGLPPDQALVVLTNNVSWEKEIAAIDRDNPKGAPCSESLVIRVPGGHNIAWMYLTPADTNWLELRKPKLGIGIYWLTVLRFTEKDFWRAFGGRKVTFVWMQE